MRSGWGAVCGLVGLASACAVVDGTKDDRPVGNGEVTDPGSTAPGITITAPVEGEGNYGNVTVSWEVTGFQLEAPGAGTAAADRGHVHVFVNGALRAESGDASITLEDLGDGPQTIKVRLVRGDERDLDVTDEVTVSVLRPAVALSPPVASPVGSWTELPLAITDLTLAATPTDTPAFGTGYYVVRVDGADWDWGVDPLKVGVGHLPAGPRVIDVELRGLDGAPLDPPVVSEPVTVQVPGGSPFVSFDHAPFTGVWDAASIPVELTVTDWDLEPPPGDAEAPPADTGAPAPVDTSPPEPTYTSGWYHLYLDGVWYDKRAEKALAIEHLPGGWHTLDIVLVDGGLGWELPIRDALKVHIAEDRPDVLITSPGDNWGVHGAFDVTVATENFTLAPDHIGGEPVADEGHFEVFVDGESKGVAGAPTTAVSGLSNGPHVVRVQLLDNAGVALQPPVYDEITVNVDSSLP